MDICRLIGFYKNNFIEISKISGGGFGSVFKVRDLVDNSLYAVKKITFSTRLKKANFDKVPFIDY